jgi:hypothetical protein
MDRKKKQRIYYPNVRTLCHQTCTSWGDLPMPELPKEYNLNSEKEEKDRENRTSRRRTYRSRLPKSSI